MRWFRAQVPAEDLWIPDGVERMREGMAEIVERGYEVVCVGGGDGTFMLVAEALRGCGNRQPAVMALRLGTGNAVHDVCGASPPTRQGLLRDLARAGDARAQVTPLRLLEVEGRLTHFAGVGLDADWAADYARLIKRHVGTGPLLPLVRGVPGYALTAVALTIPRLVRQPFVGVKLIARGPAVRLGEGGRPEGEIADGQVLYEGKATMASASTVPSYSAGFRYFRNVDRIGDAFEVKVAVASAYQVVRHARRVLGGEHDPERVLDFAAWGLRVELASEVRYHVGGDVMPATTAFTIELSRHSVPVLRAE